MSPGTKPLLHAPECPCSVHGLTREWVDADGRWPGDEAVCECDLKERIKDARAIDTRTIELPFKEPA